LHMDGLEGTTGGPPDVAGAGQFGATDAALNECPNAPGLGAAQQGMCTISSE